MTFVSIMAHRPERFPSSSSSTVPLTIAIPGVNACTSSVGECCDISNSSWPVSITHSPFSFFTVPEMVIWAFFAEKPFFFTSSWIFLRLKPLFSNKLQIGFPVVKTYPYTLKPVHFVETAFQTIGTRCTIHSKDLLVYFDNCALELKVQNYQQCYFFNLLIFLFFNQL